MMKYLFEFFTSSKTKHRSGSESESDSELSEDEFDGKNRFKVESQLNVKRFLKVKMAKLLGF